MVSKIGKLPILVAQGATAKVEGNKISISGPKGDMVVIIPPLVAVNYQDGSFLVTVDASSSNLHGLTRTLIANAITGVTTGWSKSLEMVGTGYRAVLNGKILTLSAGFSHPVNIEPPTGITFTVADQTKIQVSGVNKELVGKVAADIRRVRPPEPYKGKGIKYTDEKVRRKAGKAAKAAGGSTAK